MTAARGKVYAYLLAIKHFIFNVVAYTFCGCRANLFCDIHHYLNIIYLSRGYNKVPRLSYVYYIYFFSTF